MSKRRKRSPKHSDRPYQQRASRPVEAAVVPTRRNVLKRVRNGIIVVAGVSAGSWYIGSEVVASIDEADLAKIGNGTPTVVQIHDPQCPVCRTLQREARAALAQFEQGELQYLVANIRQDKGKRLASQHGVQHVTLLLFDGNGKRQRILAGPMKRKALELAFREHLERAQGSSRARP